MNIKIELPFEIMRSKFSKVGFIPNDTLCLANLIEARPTGQKCIYGWRDVLQILLNELSLSRTSDDVAEGKYGGGSPD